MKKFLTVLLALSVVFTYSFSTVGTAFADVGGAAAAAATVTQEKAKAATAVTAGLALIQFDADGYLENAYYATLPAVVYAYDGNITKAAVQAGADEVLKDLQKKIEDAAALAMADGTFSAIDEANVKDAWEGCISVDGATFPEWLFNDPTIGVSIAAGGGDYLAKDKALYTKALTDAKADLQSTIAKYDPSLYSTDDAKLVTKANIYANNAITDATNDATGLIDLLAKKDNYLHKCILAGAFVSDGSGTTGVADLTKTGDADAELTAYKNTANTTLDNLSGKFAAEYKKYYQDIVNNTSSSAADAAKAAQKLATADADIKSVLDAYKASVAAISLDDYSLADAKTKIDAILTDANGVYTAPSPFGSFDAQLDKSKGVDGIVAYAQGVIAQMKLMRDDFWGYAMYDSALLDEKLARLTALLKDREGHPIDGYDTYVTEASGLGDTIEEVIPTPTPPGYSGRLTYPTMADVDSWIENNVPSIRNDKTQIEATFKPAGIMLITMDDPAPTGAGSRFDALSGKYAYTNWDGVDQPAIKKIQRDYTQLINEAMTVQAIYDLVKEAQKKMDDVALRSADKAALLPHIYTCMQNLGYASGTAAQIAAGEDASGTLTNSIQKYANDKNATGAYSKAVGPAMKAAADALVKSVFDKKNPGMTHAEIQEVLKANYAAALAKIDAMKTDTELKAAETAVEAAIMALPTVASMSGKDAILAAEKMYEDYITSPGANEDAPSFAANDIDNFSKLQKCMQDLIKLEAGNLNVMIGALPLETVTAADKAKIEAARAAATAYDDTYSKYGVRSSDPYSIDYGYSDPTNEIDAAGRLTGAEKKLAEAIFNEVAKLFNVLPDADKVTKDDKAKIEAARAAYDALSDHYKAIFGSDTYKRLTDAEDAYGELVKKSKITAKSAASKGKMKITWKVANEAGDVKYQIYRSTHKNYGFGKKPMFTTTKKTYTNTKNLKKGVRYYYKVRGVVTYRGVTNYSDWSNKAFRKAK